MSDSFPALLRQMNALGATDLFLTKGKAPAYRINGKITQSEGEALSSDNLELFAIGVMSEEIYQRFLEDLEINVSYKAVGIGRFRINVFCQRQNISMVIRSIPSHIPTPSELGIPVSAEKLIMQKRGLILIVGPSGSGKSTSLASLLDQRNEHDSSHIIMVEDPIEYVLEHKQSIINQREVGIDTKSYHAALESALRQSPDVLGIGEIRSRDTMEQAIAFADSGHLCVASLHANNSVQAIDRILNLFPDTKHEQVLLSLSMHIRAIMAQQLVPNVDGKLIAVFELLQNSSHMSDLIQKGNFAGMQDFMNKEGASEMATMDQSLYDLFLQKIITGETALEYAHAYRDMRLKMRLSSANTQLVQ